MHGASVKSKSGGRYGKGGGVSVLVGRGWNIEGGAGSGFDVLS